jgi:hypothetical protein
MLIRPCQYIHTALLIYPYGPRKIFIRPCHTDQLDYLIKVLRTGCFCIGPAAGIDSRSAVLANTLKFVFIEMLDKLITYIVWWYKTVYQVLSVA